MRKLWRLGFQASLEEVVTVGGALQFLLAERFAGARRSSSARPRCTATSRPRACGSSTRTAFASRADVVVVAFHPEFHYAELRDATQAALRGAYLVGSNRDATFPRPTGCGRARARSSRRSRPRPGAPSQAVGKPEPTLVQTALDRLGARPRAHGRRPRRRRPRRGARRRHRRRGRPDRRVARARSPRPRRTRGPVAIAERLETLVLGTADAARTEDRRRPSGGRAVAPQRAAAARACPARCCCASSRGRSARLAARPARRQRGDLGDQRQDDDRRDGRGDPRGRRRAPRPQPRRGEHGRRRRQRAARRRARVVDRRRRRAVRGRRVLARPARRRSCARARCCCANLFRDQLDRYGELETIAERWAAAVAAAPDAGGSC